MPHEWIVYEWGSTEVSTTPLSLPDSDNVATIVGVTFGVVAVLCMVAAAMGFMVYCCRSR